MDKMALRRDPGIAAVLSFLIPGVGQIYNGRVGLGLVLLVLTGLAYLLLIVPGLIVHVAVIVGAYRQAQRINQEIGMT